LSRRAWLVALALLLGWAALHGWSRRAMHPAPGVLAPDAPEQIDLAQGSQLQRGDVVLTTRAHFSVTARVLSRADYHWGADATLIPEDLALGWGRMSDSAVLDHIDIGQFSRFYYWRVKAASSKGFPIPRGEIERSSANMHLIPADAGVRRAMGHVRVGQLVHIEGFLVDASRTNGWQWRTSMTREDTGSGACELVFVERLSATSP
jgi:hypothetical protein